MRQGIYVKRKSTYAASRGNSFPFHAVTHIIILSCYHVIIKGVPKKKAQTPNPKIQGARKTKPKIVGFFVGPLNFGFFFAAQFPKFTRPTKKTDLYGVLRPPLNFWGYFYTFRF